ncbi:MAG: hypothetical protein ACLVJB_00120 [Christensenellales bacterium]
MPPHEKEKRFGGEGEKHGFNGIVDDDLSVVHQLGLPDSMLGSAWPAMNVI